MGDITMPEISRKMASQRRLIPLQNRQKFDAEAAEFFDEMNRASASGNTDRLRSLIRSWEDRAEILRTSFRCHVAPVCLPRRDGESIEDWINRCLTKGGFYHAK